VGPRCVEPRTCVSGTQGCACSLGNRCDDNLDCLFLDALGDYRCVSSASDGTRDECQPDGRCVDNTLLCQRTPSGGRVCVRPRYPPPHEGAVGLPGLSCDPCDSSCAQGFRCSNSRAKCISCVGGPGCGCHANRTCSNPDTFSCALSHAPLPGASAGLNVFNYRLVNVSLSHDSTTLEWSIEEPTTKTLVSAGQLMRMHGRLLHVVIAKLPDGGWFLHQHPDDFLPALPPDQTRFALRNLDLRKGQYIVGIDVMHHTQLDQLKQVSLSAIVQVVGQPTVDAATASPGAFTIPLDEETTVRAPTYPVRADDDAFMRSVPSLPATLRPPADATNGVDLKVRVQPYPNSTCALLTVRLADPAAHHPFVPFLDAPLHAAAVPTGDESHQHWRLVHAHGAVSVEAALARGCGSMANSYTGPVPLETDELAVLIPLPRKLDLVRLWTQFALASTGEMALLCLDLERAKLVDDEVVGEEEWTCRDVGKGHHVRGGDDEPGDAMRARAPSRDGGAGVPIALLVLGMLMVVAVGVVLVYRRRRNARLAKIAV